ncbi:MAG: 50S ribosomal protein L29 [Chloroflexi bacterium]|nr:50S ribosomal protein L29 [Chloroflexota bacterium]
MKASEIRALTTEEIRARLDQAYQEYYELRVSFRIGQLKNTARLREARKDIARLRTVLRERELAGEA